MREFFRAVIRLLTGRVRYERQVAMLAAQLATEEAYLTTFDRADLAAEHIRHFLLVGEFAK